jgi:hypothetical protein
VTSAVTRRLIAPPWYCSSARPVVSTSAYFSVRPPFAWHEKRRLW